MKINVELLSILCTLTLLIALPSHGKHHPARIQGPMSDRLLRKSIIGPSWEFYGVDHKWNWKVKYNDVEFEALSVFVNGFKRSHEFAKNQLITMFGKESAIESRLKPMKSIGEELDEDGNRTVKDIYDIVSWRVTFPTVQQVLKAKARFINDSRFAVAIVKCFGVCPRGGKYAATGYRGITLIAEVDGKPMEIQLVTPYMVMWADWAYTVLLKKSLGTRKEVTKYALNLSDYYYNLDKIRDKRPQCPQLLLNANMKKLTAAQKKNKIFESLGSPPSGCQFWNDLTVNKNTNIGARRTVLGIVGEQESAGGKGTRNKPRVIDIDKVLKPENLKESGLKKRTLQHPVYYYY